MRNCMHGAGVIKQNVPSTNTKRNAASRMFHTRGPVTVMHHDKCLATKSRQN